MNHGERPWAVVLLIPLLHAIACNSAPGGAASPASSSSVSSPADSDEGPPPSAAARALLDAALNGHVVKNHPTLTKMTLVKLLPRHAALLSDPVEATLSDARLQREVCRRIDSELAADVRVAAQEEMSQPAWSRVMLALRGVGAPKALTPGTPIPAADARSLFALLRPPGDADKLVRAPVVSAIAIAQAALAADDPRQPELAAFSATLTAVPRAQEEQAFVARLSGLFLEDIAPVLECLRAGPCAAAERAVVQAHLAAVEQLTDELVQHLRAAPPLPRG